MSWSGVVWVVGGVMLVAAGFLAVAVPLRRSGALERRTEWSGARAAADTAAVSRDACPVTVVEADQLLHRAELILAGRGGRSAARSAAEYAHRADLLWRDAANG
jgi:3-deoxy-D-manno-octulosonate 8-phosphate phosphatase KdsC-like HAD superfamily phosphatase